MASARCTTRVPHALTAAANSAGWSKAPSGPATEKLTRVSQPSTAFSWAECRVACAAAGLTSEPSAWIASCVGWDASSCRSATRQSRPGWSEGWTVTAMSSAEGDAAAA
eukprot:14110800-Alexandrium_andersonii.AAC.1